ncbi:cadherin-like beta sandwich domain-containing protein [Treponema primitia]|uniref:fibronectin type III domain-containing protein n=1 Tax=Treponema primitia TaxID=88058 RepID=UPI00398148F1
MYLFPRRRPFPSFSRGTRGILCLFSLVLLSALLFSCDLFLSKPKRNVLDDVDYEVWLAKAPKLDVQMAPVPGSGISNPPTGHIDPQPKLEVPFNVNFTPNPEYGFVEWRAYGTGDTIKDEETKLGAEWVRFNPANSPETEVTILSNEAITLVPFSDFLPRVEHNLPNGTFERLSTNYPVELRFNVPIDPASLVLGAADDTNATITITGIKSQGNGVFVDLWQEFYPPKIDNGRWILIPKNAGFNLANCDITVTLKTGIRHEKYPLYMAQNVSLSYGVTNGPDTSLPVVEKIRWTHGTEAGNTLYAGVTADPELPQNRTVYFFFDAYKAQGKGTIRELRITEERIRGFSGEILTGQEQTPRVYLNADDHLNNISPLAQEYLDTGTMPYVVEYQVQSTEQGTIRFYIQPVDSFLNGTDNRMYYIDALLDLPPKPVSGLTGVYDKSGTSRIILGWGNPADPDLDHINVDWGVTGLTPTTIPNIGKPNSYDFPGIPSDGKSYTFTLTAVDVKGKGSPVQSITVIADATIPSPVTITLAEYTPNAIHLKWTNPPGADRTDIRVNWTGPSNGQHPLGKDIDEDWIYGIPQAPGALYTVTVTAVNSAGSKEIGVSSEVYADLTPPNNALMELAGVYNGVTGKISISWKESDVSDLKGIYLQWYTGSSPDPLPVPLNPLPLNTVFVPRGSEKYTTAAAVRPGVKYKLRAWMEDYAGNIDRVNPYTIPGYVSTDLTPPGPVAINSAAYNPDPSNTITLSWTNPGDPDLDHIKLRYWNTRQGVSTAIEETILTLTLSKTITNVVYNYGEYVFSLVSVDEFGNESNPVSITVRTDNKPATPGGLTVNATSESGKLLVNWDSAGGADAYDVLYNSGNNQLSATLVGGDIIGNSVTISDLPNGVPYYVWVRAKKDSVDGDVLGDWSAPVTGIPRNNAALLQAISINSVYTTVFDSNQLTYSLTVPSNTESITVVGEPETGSNGKVSYKFGSGGVYGDVNISALNSGYPSLVFIRVTAENGTDSKDYTITVLRKYAVPAGLTVNRVPGESGKLRVSWTPVNGNSVYTVKYGTDTAADGGPPSAALVANVTGAASHDISYLEPGTSYYVWVSAGSGPAESDFSGSVTGTVGWETKELESLTVNGQVLDPAESPLPAVTIPYDSNTIILNGVAKKNGIVRYQFGSGSRDTVNTGNIDSGTELEVKIWVYSEGSGLSGAGISYTITVIRPRQLNIVVTGPGDFLNISPETATLRFGSNDRTTFSVSGTAAGDSITWSVDGKDLDNALDTEHGHAHNGTTKTVTLYARDYLVTTHTLTVLVNKGGVRYTRSVKFTVTQ